MKISFLVPIRNNPDNACRTISSILALQLSDFEIIVSNNSEPDSSDLMIKKLQTFPQDKIIILNQKKNLVMSDNWRVLVKAATGDWVTVVTDRSVLHKNYYTKLYEHTKKHSIISYGSSGIFKRGNFYYLQLPRFTGNYYNFTAENELDKALQMSFGWKVPTLLNTLVRRDILNLIEKKLGYCLGDIIADTGFYSEVLALNFNWLYVDNPLFIMHSAEGGIGNALSQGVLTPAVESLLKDVEQMGGLYKTALPSILSNMNIRAHELNSALMRAGKHNRVDLFSYCRSLWKECKGQKKHFPSCAPQLVKNLAHSIGCQLSLDIPMVNLNTLKSVRNIFLIFGPFLYKQSLNSILNLPVHISDTLNSSLDFAVSNIFKPNTRMLNRDRCS